MSSPLNISGPIGIGSLAANPSNPKNGFIYYNSADNEFRMYKNGTWLSLADEEAIAALTGTDIAYARADGSKKNIDAASDDLESAISDLDDAIGALEATPTNYTPTDASIVADHLAAIDAALVSAGGTEFADNAFRIQDNGDATKEIAFEAAAITTGTTRTITMPDEDVDLGDISINTGAIDANTTDIADLRTLSGTADGETDLGTFTGSVIPDDSDMKEALQALETEVELKLDADQVGVADGVASLDSNGKVPLGQLPNSIMEYKGVWSASTNTPTLANGAGNADTAIGDVYRVTSAGTVDFGAGDIDFEIGDYAILNDSKIWERAITSEIVGGVSSVNGEVGDVVLDSSDLDHSQADAADWTVADDSPISAHLDELAARTTDIETALPNKLENVVEDTTPELGGDLEVGANAIESAANEIVLAGQNSVRRAKQASKSSFVEEEYLASVALAASQTNTVIGALTFAHATIEGLEIVYKIKEATSNDVRIGTLRVVTNGTDVALNDVSTETADTGISFDAVVNGADINIRYSSGANAATMRADVKRFQA